MSLSLLKNYGIIPSASIVSFDSQWDTSLAGISASDEIALPLTNVGGEVYDFKVLYNDVVIKSITSYLDNVVLFPDGAGIKDIKIIGTIKGFSFSGVTDKLKIKNITKWGQSDFINATSTFDGCENLIITADDTPVNLLSFSDWTSTFRQCYNLTISNFVNWDFINVLSLKAFDMFPSGNDVFNPDLSNYVHASVTNVGNFRRCRALVGTGVSSWITTSVLEFSPFSDTIAFNQDLTNIDSTSFVTIDRGFAGSSSFTGVGLDTWFNKVANLEDMDFAFTSTAITTDLFKNWVMPKLKSAQRAFYTLPVDFDLSGWTWTNVENADQILTNTNTSTANYDLLLASIKAQGFDNGGTVLSAVQISGVEVEIEVVDHNRVIGDTLVLGNASGFTPSAYDGTFVVTSVTNTSKFRVNLLSDPLGDATVIGSYGSLKSNVPFGVSAQYSAGTPATNRASIVSAYSWIITDDGQI